jgi:probable phosphoglycerate mutase
MSENNKDKDFGVPRVFLYRHGKFQFPRYSSTSNDVGQTEWTKNGRYTGATELELTPYGENQVKASGKMIVGPGRLIDPSRLAHVYISPRKRALQTFEIAFSDADRQALKEAKKVTETERLTEWDYGLYEGSVTSKIRALRKEHGLDTEREWDIWRDGCEGGE